MTAAPSVIDDLVAANRILAGLGVLDGFGHVSARHPEHADLTGRGRTQGRGRMHEREESGTR